MPMANVMTYGRTPMRNGRRALPVGCPQTAELQGLAAPFVYLIRR